MEYADQDLTLRNPIGDLRSSSTTGAYKNGGSCQKEYADQNLISRNRSALPRRLDFDEKVYDNGKGENDSENKSQSASKMMSPLEASNSNNLSGKKRLCQTNSQVDSIKTARTSSRCVLGTLCIDLASGTIRKKKQDSHTTCDFVNSEENVNESTSNYKPNKPPKETNAVCPSSGLNHKLFLCPCEMKRSQKLTADIPLTQRKVVPGGDGEADFMIRESAVILDRMIRVVTESHCRDICFKGNLSLENFLMTEDGEMKLMGVESHHISTRGAELDNIKVADIIEFEFFADRKIPPSIEELVRLLRTGERGDERTMSNNISLMPEMERMSLFEWMLKELHKLKAIDPTAHKALKLKLEQRIRWHEWKRKAERNEHLLKILNYRDPVTRVLVSYPDTMEGLLQFIRNSIEHLHKHSYDYATQSSLYYLFEIDHIVSGTFQGLFEILQSVMSASGKLSHWK